MTVKVLSSVVSLSQLRRLSICMVDAAALDSVNMQPFGFIARDRKTQESQFGHFDISTSPAVRVSCVDGEVHLYGDDVAFVGWGPTADGDYMYALRRADHNYLLKVHIVDRSGAKKAKVTRTGYFDCQTAFEAVFKHVMSKGSFGSVGLYRRFLEAQKEDLEAAKKKAPHSTRQFNETCVVDFQTLCAVSLALTNPPKYRRALVEAMAKDGVVISTTSVLQNRSLSGRTASKFTDLSSHDNWEAFVDVSYAYWGPTPNGDRLTATRVVDGSYALTYTGVSRDPVKHPAVAEFDNAQSAYCAIYEMVSSEQLTRLKPGFCKEFADIQAKLVRDAE